MLKDLVERLVRSNVAKIITHKQNGRLSQFEIELALTDYSGQLTMPPAQAYNAAKVYEVYDQQTQATNSNNQLK